MNKLEKRILFYEILDYNGLRDQNKNKVLNTILHYIRNNLMIDTTNKVVMCSAIRQYLYNYNDFMSLVLCHAILQRDCNEWFKLEVIKFLQNRYYDYGHSFRHLNRYVEKEIEHSINIVNNKESVRVHPAIVKCGMVYISSFDKKLYNELKLTIKHKWLIELCDRFAK